MISLSAKSTANKSMSNIRGTCAHWQIKWQNTCRPPSLGIGGVMHTLEPPHGENYKFSNELQLSFLKEDLSNPN